jgi:hypothetical protein
MHDLGRSADAAQYASRCLVAADQTASARSNFFAMMIMADAHLSAGDLELACDVAINALAEGEQIRSARCVNYLREFHQHLTAAGKNSLAIDFQQQASTSRLWRIATRPSESAA